MLPGAQRLESSDATVLCGEGAALDSLGLVNLVVLLEREIADTTGVQLSLSEDPDLLGEHGPLGTLGELRSYLAGRLRIHDDG
jgi:hypothetical protein